MAGNSGRPRGRPPGAKNKRTEARERAVAEVAETIAGTIDGAFEGDAHALLMAVYKNPVFEMQLRLDAAKAAVRYEKPALASIEATGKGGEALIPTVAIEFIGKG